MVEGASAFIPGNSMVEVQIGLARGERDVEMISGSLDLVPCAWVLFCPARSSVAETLQVLLMTGVLKT